MPGDESGSLGQLCQAAGGTARDSQDPDLQQWHGCREGAIRLTLNFLGSYGHLMKVGMTLYPLVNQRTNLIVRPLPFCRLEDPFLCFFFSVFFPDVNLPKDR